MKKGVYQKVVQSDARHFLFDLNLGLEKECIRVNSEGEIMDTPHPKRLGDKLTNPYITTDFAESQLELITKPLPSIKECYGFLETLFDVVCESLPKNEFLWEQSAPPAIRNEDDIKISSFGPAGADKEAYREHLALSYGKKRQLYSGIHYNFSFSDKFLHVLHQEYIKEYASFEDFKDQVYLKVTRQLLKNRWMIIQLLGASPATHNSLMGRLDCSMDSTQDFDYLPYGNSARTSICGYRNKEDFILDYSSVSSYLESIDQLLKEGRISSSKELYNPVRVKLDNNNRVSYLEIRLLDNFPFSKTGVSEKALYNLHYFILSSFLFDEESGFDKKEQVEASNNHNLIASSGRKPGIEVVINGSSINPETYLSSLKQRFIKELLPLTPEHLKKEYNDAFERLIHLVDSPEERPAAQLLKAVRKQGFVNFHMKLAKQNKDEALNKSYRFHGFEDLELSTQLLLKDTLRRGVFFDILDRKANFIRLSKDGKTQYVQQATKTALDNYASILMMENKIVTKRILEENGVRSPKGAHYHQDYLAKSDFNIYKGKAIVIKPNSTNFGLGITILKENTNQDLFNRAIEMAFEHDDTILIEEFISGKEYRVFLINHEVVGILHRVPANVTGDGIHSIRELVDIKNQNPLRGKGYKTPLEKINKGEPEMLFLETQGLNFESIPEKDKIVFLRENSNISTGGDSIDFTDDIHQSYKDISSKASRALGVAITGLDIMIDDYTQQASPENQAIIELNFNPAIHIHCYPFIGKNRRLNEKILEALGF